MGGRGEQGIVVATAAATLASTALIERKSGRDLGWLCLAQSVYLRARWRDLRGGGVKGGTSVSSGVIVVWACCCSRNDKRKIICYVVSGLWSPTSRSCSNARASWKFFMCRCCLQYYDIVV